MLKLEFISIASSKDTIIEQLKETIHKLEQTLMTVKDRDEAFVTQEYGKYSLKVSKIDWGKKELFDDLWPKQKGK